MFSPVILMTGLFPNPAMQDGRANQMAGSFIMFNPVICNDGVISEHALQLSGIKIQSSGAVYIQKRGQYGR